MTICRFSHDQYRCDIYTYQSEDGYVLHVAGTRLLWDPPLDPMSPEALNLPAAQWSTVQSEYLEQLTRAPRAPLEHPEAGTSHTFATIRELKDKILELARTGIRIPAWLPATLDELASEEQEPEPEN